MVDHHIQKKIIADLVECETARFADLKPAHIDSNVFTYHLRSLMEQKLITKNEDGLYELTSQGKLYGINSSLRKHDLLSQAHSIILLSVRDENDRWLLRRRLVQPLYGKVGFIHGEPLAGETVVETAARVLQTRTELQGEFVVKGSGYVCLRHNGDLVAYSHFTLLEANKVQGALRASDPHGENVWMTQPDFSGEDMIPSMQDIVNYVLKPGLFFVDLSYDTQ